MVNLQFYLYGVQIFSFTAPTVPRKGDHVHWNGKLLEVAMVVWRTPNSAVHLYLATDPFNNPLPAGLEEPEQPVSTNL